MKNGAQKSKPAISDAQEKPSRRGRPTREQARQRHAELLSTSFDLFLEKGYEGATMDDVAAALGMSKRTIYSYYDDKEALFRAVVSRAIADYTVDREALERLRSDDLRETLMRVGRLRISNMANRNAIGLQRILTAQAAQFPDLFRQAFEEGVGPTIAFLIALLRDHAGRGEIKVENPRLAATTFLSMTAGGAVRTMVSGQPLSQDDIEERLRFSVDLFLNGIAGR
ncbi:TetR/AcrR family transcriptional regulator [Stakelama tenebrarum]|uniref:TetR/AcrR family transcriptional regulator n=1 Tax=Stakelama tenebrarum TaxID=2711215 RepID=A0A6G6Y3Q3_9SPHN|nr:TetR/AcrR family transcriptional regulator [Sphingosinithalassobacter tenebrarum]QIG79348.1 TetR/AcrR family transcriptional regulator [Sphingosinithalassobacter tenebrarum]